MAVVEFFHIQQKGKLLIPFKSMPPCVMGTAEETNIGNHIGQARELE